jgi:hypothetical protein
MSFPKLDRASFPFAPSVYLVQLSSRPGRILSRAPEIFLKVGYTGKDHVRKRFRLDGDACANYRIELYECERVRHVADAEDLEQDLLASLKLQFGQHEPSFGFSGQSECFRKPGADLGGMAAIRRLWNEEIHEYRRFLSVLQECRQARTVKPG